MSHSVLIVDDSGYSRSTIRQILEQAGYKILGEAKDGAEALDLIEELDPDLITLDNVLPDMTGLKVLETIKEQKIRCKVVMVSAVGQQSAIEEGLDLGANAYIIKPFNAEKLLDEVRRSLNS